MAERKQVPIGLRVPPDLATWLKREAEVNHRSLANQTAWFLEQYRKQQDAHAKT